MGAQSPKKSDWWGGDLKGVEPDPEQPGAAQTRSDLGDE